MTSCISLSVFQVESFVNTKLGAAIKTQYGQESREGTKEAIDVMQKMVRW